jgi:Zn-dependent M28 family amino/carboxypeptidase
VSTTGDEILRLVEEQVGLGPRVPGTAAHDQLARVLEDRLRAHAAEVIIQEFPVLFRGSELSCRNVIGVFRSAGPAAEPPLLLGTHYDTRIRADRERDTERREIPIPGANDGGSGTAVFLHLLSRLAGHERTRDIAVAFLDAEDLGNIDGKDFALGSEWLAAHPLEGFTPSEVVMLDMVGGKDMVLDIDAHILSQPGSRTLTTDVFQIGMSQGWGPFIRDKKERLKYVISDHTPFARRGTPACILMDIDYPEWHTQADLPRAMSAESLGIMEEAIWLFLTARTASGPRSFPGT